MGYDKLTPADFFNALDSEDEARLWLWRARFGGEDFVCPHCSCKAFYSLRTRPEVRKCRQCRRHIRLRAKTALEHSKVPVLTWLRALFLMTQDKRGISTQHLQRELAMRSFATSWLLLHKIRHGLMHRDSRYKLDGVLELDGADFRRQASGQDARVLIAVETKEWIDSKKKFRTRAGFAKVMLGTESLINVQRLVCQSVQPTAIARTDGCPTFPELQFIAVAPQTMLGIKHKLDHWLPWVHRFIANAKTWLMGTHHGVDAKYLPYYLGEFTYRFNRRHDQNGLFHRALTACALSTPITLGALSG